MPAYQVAVLNALAASGDPLSNAELSDKLGIHVTTVRVGVGSTDKAANAKIEKQYNVKTLLSRGLIRFEDVEQEGRKADHFAITTRGRKELHKALAHLVAKQMAELLDGKVPMKRRRRERPKK